MRDIFKNEGDLQAFIDSEKRAGLLKNTRIPANVSLSVKAETLEQQLRRAGAIQNSLPQLARTKALQEMLEKCTQDQKAFMMSYVSDFRLGGSKNRWESLLEVIKTVGDQRRGNLYELLCIFDRKILQKKILSADKPETESANIFDLFSTPQESIPELPREIKMRENPRIQEREERKRGPPRSASKRPARPQTVGGIFNLLEDPISNIAEIAQSELFTPLSQSKSSSGKIMSQESHEKTLKYQNWRVSSKICLLNLSTSVLEKTVDNDLRLTGFLAANKGLPGPL